MVEKRGLTLPEFSALLESSASLKGLEYLESPVKQLWERCLAAVTYPWLLPLVGLQVIQVLAADGRPVIYDMARSNIPEEVREAVLKTRGVELKIPKIRSMRRGADGREPEILQAMTLKEFEDGDDRIIKCRWWWRKCRGDEDPDWGAIVMGNLSLVGPRLPTKAEWENEVRNQQNEAFSEFRRLMLTGIVIPGVVGAYFLLKPGDRYAGEEEYIHQAADRQSQSGCGCR